MASDPDPAPGHSIIGQLPVRTVPIASLTPGPYLRPGGASTVHAQMLADANRTDPAIRYAEGGESFLRCMARHAAHADEWRELIDAIPIHWLSVVAPIADGVSDEWSEFTEELRRRQEVAN